ncbi:MAG: hypothetical protein Q9164_004159 [Protoblastenia rupestris]
MALPIDPFYKAECEVATTEYVRFSTSIKVPLIYAFDSSSNNAIGHEWILMEKIEGISLHRAWDTASLDAKARMTRDVAGWEGKCLGYKVERGPFSFLHRFYKAILEVSRQHWPEEVKRKQLASSSMKQFYPGNLNEVVLVQADLDDVDALDIWEFYKKEIIGTLREVENLQTLLPTIYPRPLDGQPMNTLLQHWDLSEDNIFVDDNGKPTAFIDWERIQPEPLEEVYEEGDVPEDLIASENAVAVNLQAMKDDKDEASYLYNKREMEKSKLCKVWREELERLHSPLLEVEELDPKGFDISLAKYVMFPTMRRPRATVRAMDSIPDSFFEGSQDDDQPKSREEDAARQA